jgi:hypothetical protein
MKKHSLSRFAANCFTIRVGLALILAVPLSAVPSQNELPALAVVPDSVAFSQAGVSAAPTEWAERILVEDFNDTGDTQAQLNSTSGIDSPVGTFRGSGSGSNIYNESQWGGAPCNDCATTSTTTTTTTSSIQISSEFNPDPDADPSVGHTRFDQDISFGSANFLANVWIIYVDTSEDLNGVSSVEITNSSTSTSYTASISSMSDFGTEIELYISVWEADYSTVQFNVGDQLSINASVTTTETVTTTTPGVNGRESKNPAVNNATITLTLASSTTYRYLGFWWSAGNAGNNICLLPATGSTCIAEYNTSDLVGNASFSTVGVSAPAWQNNRPHYGNPRGRVYTGTTACNGVSDSYGTPGELYSDHCNEPYAFIHIFQDSGFRRVQFSGVGFEFDNVTASTAESWELIDLLPAGTLIGASTLPAYSVTSPSVIPIDPRSDSVSFPGVLLGGAAANQPNASLCVTEVDSGGTPVAAGTSNLQISATVPAGVDSQSSAPRFVYSGARETIRNLSATIRVNSATNSENVVSSESKYLRISVQARTGTGLTTCAGTNNVITAVIVELRPLRINASNFFGIRID